MLSYGDSGASGGGGGGAGPAITPKQPTNPLTMPQGGGQALPPYLQQRTALAQPFNGANSAPVLTMAPNQAPNEVNPQSAQAAQAATAKPVPAQPPLSAPQPAMTPYGGAQPVLKGDASLPPSTGAVGTPTGATPNPGFIPAISPGGQQPVLSAAPGSAQSLNPVNTAPTIDPADAAWQKTHPNPGGIDLAAPTPQAPTFTPNAPQSTPAAPAGPSNGGTMPGAAPPGGVQPGGLTPIGPDTNTGVTPQAVGGTQPGTDPSTDPSAQPSGLQSTFDYFKNQLENQRNTALSSAITDAQARGVYYGTPLTTSQGDINTSFQQGLGSLAANMFNTQSQQDLQRLGLATSLVGSTPFANTGQTVDPSTMSTLGQLFGSGGQPQQTGQPQITPATGPNPLAAYGGTGGVGTWSPPPNIYQNWNASQGVKPTTQQPGTFYGGG